MKKLFYLINYLIMKYLSIFLCGILFAATSVYAQFSGTTGNLAWEITGGTGNYTLTITGEGKIPDYFWTDGNRAPWDVYRESIVNVVIEKGITGIGSHAFWFHGNLKSAMIPNSVKRIESFAFRGTGLREIIIPDSVTFIGFSAFQDCQGLTSVTIPNSVITLDGNVFTDCNNLANVTIGNSVTAIGNSVFLNNWNLTKITNLATEPQPINANVFEKVNKSAVTLYVPYCSIDAYRDTDVWKEFINIQAIDGSNRDCDAGCKTPLISGKAGALAWVLCNDGTLTISGKGDMPDYAQHSDPPWWDYRNSISNVVIEHGVTTIGDYSLNYIPMISLSIPSSATRIGHAAFYACSKLTSVTIPESVTTIRSGAGAFSGCVSITAFTVDADNPAFISIDGVLFSKDQKRLVIYPSAKTGSAYDIPATVNIIGNHAFNTKKQLTSLTIPNSVTKIEEWAFNQCVFSSLTIPESVTAIDHAAFYGCGKMTSLTFGNSLAVIGTYAFYNCTGLTTITIPESVKTIGIFAFGNCTNIKEITNKAETPQKIDASVFDKVDKIACILRVPFCSVAGYRAAAVWGEFENIKGSFHCQGAGITLDISELTLAIGDSERLIATVTPDDGANPVVKWESDNESVATVSADGTVIAISEGKATIRVTTDDGDFTDECMVTVHAINEGDCVIIESGTAGTLQWAICTDGTLTISGDGEMPDYSSQHNDPPWWNYRNNITNVVIEDGITTIGDYSLNYIPMTSVRFPNSLTRIGHGAFYACGRLTSVTIPDSVTTIRSGAGAFWGCGSLTEFIVGSNNPAFVSIDGVLFSKDIKTLVAYPLGKTGLSYHIPATVNTIGHSAFHRNQRLSYITFPNSLTTIEDWAFDRVMGLDSITIPDSVTEIRHAAFYGCGNLSSVTFGNSLTLIGTYAFYNCAGLTSISIPNSVKTIGIYAFADCTNLTEIINDAETPQIIDASVFDNVDKIACILRVPSCSVKKYRDAEGWGDFINIEGSIDCEATVITLDISELTLSMGSAERLTATVIPDDGANLFVKWESDNESVATVSEDGTVTAISAGTAIIKATTKDGGSSAICTVTVVAPQGVADFEDVPPGCMPYHVQFENTSRYASAYYWDFGDGNSSTVNHP